MKSQQAELSHIIDIVNRLGLAHPEISFSLISDGKEMTRTAGTGQLRQAIAGIYGLASAKKMIEIENSDLDFEISGFVSLPELTRANRNYISLFINGRYIKNFLLNRAILDGYGSKLMVGRFPLAVIHIHIDPYLADVNVHPTKQEVRISKEKRTDDTGFRSYFQQSQGANLDSRCLGKILPNRPCAIVRRWSKLFSHSKKIRSTMRKLSRQDLVKLRWLIIRWN